MSTMYQHESLDYPTWEAAVRPLPVRVATRAAVADGPPSVGGPAAMARPGAEQPRDCPGDGAASPAGPARLDAGPYADAARGAAGVQWDCGSGRDIRGRPVEEQTPAPTTSGHQAGTGHLQDPGVRDPLTRGAGVGPDRPGCRGADAPAPHPTPGEPGLHRVFRYLAQLHGDRGEGVRSPVG